MSAVEAKMNFGEEGSTRLGSSRNSENMPLGGDIDSMRRWMPSTQVGWISSGENQSREGQLYSPPKYPPPPNRDIYPVITSGHHFQEQRQPRLFTTVSDEAGVVKDLPDPERGEAEHDDATKTSNKWLASLQLLQSGVYFTLSGVLAYVAAKEDRQYWDKVANGAGGTTTPRAVQGAASAVFFASGLDAGRRAIENFRSKKRNQD